MNIKHTLFGLFIPACFALLFSSCARNDFRGSDDGSEKLDDVKLNVRVDLDTKAGAVENAEDIMKSVRVLVFVSTQSTGIDLPAGYVLVNNRYDNTSDIPTLRFTPGLRDVYVVVNETEQMSERLNKVRNVSQLHAINVAYNPLSPSSDEPFVMCANQLGQTFGGGQTADLSLDLLRVAAKATFDISFDAQMLGIDPGLKGKSLEVDSVRIIHISDSTMLSSVAPIYVVKRWVEGPRLDVVAPQDSKKWTISGVLYLTERLFAQGTDSSDPEQATYMMVYGRLNGDVACRYRINIGNGASKEDLVKDYTITRNTHYDIRGTITKLGEMDGVDVVIDVAPWNMVEGDLDVGIMYKKLTSTDGSFVMNDYLDDDASAYISWTGDKVRFYYETDTDMDDECYVTITKIDNGTPTTIYTSTPGDVVRTSSRERYVQFTFPAPGQQEPYIEYRINLHVPLLDRDNPNNAPFKSVKIMQDGGVIPSSVLVKYFTADGHLFKGWPDDESLPRGLQIAKTGNVLPSGQALSVDPMAQWSTEEIDTRVTALACGMGKGNTAELLKLGPAKYPAVNLCRALGPEWYFPSRNELLLIYANKGLLSPDYSSFSANYYWSASQSSDYYSGAWYVYFHNGYTTINNSKASNFRVRCVRDI